MLLWAMWLTGLFVLQATKLLSVRKIDVSCMRSYTNLPLKRPLFISLGILFFWVFFGLVWCAVGSWCRIFTKNERLIFPNNILNLDTWIIHLNTSFVSLGMFKIFIMEIIAFLCCSLCICTLKIILKLGIYIYLRLVTLYTFRSILSSSFNYAANSVKICFLYLLT